MKQNLWSLSIHSSVLLVMMLMLAGCSDDPKPANEEELITNVNLTFRRDAELPAEQITFSWSDPDGELGSGTAEIDDISLDADANYRLEITLGDHSSGSLTDVTNEIFEEANDHQFFFILNSSLNGVVEFSYDDEDENGKPVGLENIVETMDAGSGTLTLILRHKPKKGASGVAEGDITKAGGDTDIEITFNLEVQD